MVDSAKQFQPGDWVVYTKTKYSEHPGPRAQNVSPATSGDTYAYTVEKFWAVSEILEDGRLVLHTRRGKRHVVDPDDRALRLASWWKRWLYRDRFPELPSHREPEVANA